MLRTVVFLSGALLATLGSAVDGVIEINQAKALAGGVTPSDGPGYPVTISAGGSYRLTSNLVAGVDATAIQVSVDAEPKFVDLDLNGFTIVGPVTCSVAGALNCNMNGSTVGYGITTNSGLLRIHDGVVQGFASNCVDNSVTASSLQLRNLDLRWCNLGANAQQGIVENVNAKQNRAGGIFASRSVLQRIVSEENAGDGISLSNSTLDHCTADNNEADGIDASASSLVRNCLSFSNPNGYGLRCSGANTCGYAGNSFHNNGTGTVLNGVELGPNLCDGDATCP